MTTRLLLLLLVTSSSLQAQQTPSPWRTLAAGDLEAAYILIRDNHPGAVPAIGDEAFQRALRGGHAEAKARLSQVATYGGYEATLRAFALGFGDKHVQFLPAMASRSLGFAGWIVARRGASWVVVDEDLRPNEVSRNGQRLISCDGVEAEPFAERRRGGFRAVWSVEAQRIQHSSWLLVDDGNPFLTRPKSCVFDRDGKPEPVALTWRSMDRARLEPRLSAAVRTGAAGFGVRPFGAGFWIAVESLSDSAKPVVEEVARMAEALRAAPIVVLDMRGNSGGSSLFGRQIARTLYGSQHVEAKLAGGSSACTAVWRASEGNLAAVQAFVKASASRGPEFVREFSANATSIQQALDKGAALTGEPKCPPARATTPATIPPSLFPGRMVLLTDHACFSSCLLVTDDFRRLGALHVGEATDAATRYMEVRSVRLPSGLGSFSTLQKVAIGIPHLIGPFVPGRIYDGDIADTAALERWVAQTVRAR